MTMFEIALAYTQAVVDLGALYHDQDRNECPELWVKHDELYKQLFEAQQQYNKMQAFYKACMNSLPTE